MTQVRSPRLLKKLLSGNRLQMDKRFDLCSLSLDINDSPVSTADMTLTEKDPDVKMHDLVELWYPHGLLGIYRVVHITTTYGNQRVVRLNHGIDIFNDVILAEEVEFTGTVREALQKFIAAQTEKVDGKYFWQLGTVEDTNTYTFKADYGTVLTLMQNLLDHENDYWFTYDFTTFPWTLNLVRKPETIVTTFRLSRNVNNLQVAMDDSKLCTRLYLGVETQQTDEYGSETVTTYEINDNAAGIADFGIVSKTETIGNATDKNAWLSKYFELYGQPELQITIDAAELYGSTSDIIDRINIGEKCKVLLPKYSQSFTERVVQIRYPDVLRQPSRCTVSLANKRHTVSDSFKQESQRTSSLERQQKETTAKQEKADKKSEKNSKDISKNSQSIANTNLDLIATKKTVDSQGETLHKAGIEIDADGVFIFAKKQGALGEQIASIDVRADEITQTVKNNRSDMDQGFSQITQRADSIAADVVDLTNATEAHFKVTDEAITSEVTRATDAESALSSNITQTAEEIRSEVSNSIDGVNSEITQTAEEIRSEVSDSVSGLSSRISQTESDIELNAKNIKIIADDYVTINKLETEISSIEMAIADKIDTAYLYATTGTINQANIYDVTVDGTSVGVHTISIDGTAVSSYVGTADVNFDRAAARKEGADSVTLSSAGWQSGGRNIVSATNGQSLTVNLPSFTSNQTDWNSSYQKTVNFSTSSVSVPLSSVTVDASELYSNAHAAGVADGKAACGVAVNTSNKTVAVTTSTTKSVTVSAEASIGYSSSTHKYTATGKAKAGGQDMDSATATSGTEAYDAGHADGLGAAGVTVNTDSKTVSVTTSTTKSVTVSAEASIAYSSSTHKYTATGRARAGGKAVDYATAASGTEAYDDGKADGLGAAGVAVNKSNKTVYVTTSNTKSVVVSAVAEISYNSGTHKYTAISRAKAGGLAMDYASAASGTEAYQAGIDSVDTQSYYDSGFKAGWQSYYNASGWNKNSNGQVLIPASSGSGSEVWFDLADELPSVTFNWWNPAKGVAGVYFYIWGKYYGTSHEIPPGWM